MTSTSPQQSTPGPHPPAPIHWLSTALIVAGLLVLVAGGVLAYVNLAAYAEPPPPVGLEENPLPVVTDSNLPPPEANYITPTPTPALIPSPAVTRTGAVETSELDVPAGPPPSPTPTAILPAASPPTRIVAPAIGLDASVVPVGWKEITQDGKKVSVWEVAEYAAGWHKNSALPGQGGNIVLSGHHNIKGEVFRYLVDLKPGDAVTLYADGRPYTYTVEARLVVPDKGEPEAVRLENARWIGPFPDERLTLVTCWPYTNNTHRVIVIAKPTG